MKPKTRDLAKHLIALHEGCKLKPYLDTEGIETIGYGRNLKDRGISLSEAEFLLNNDIDIARQDLVRNVPCFRHLSAERQAVLVDMSVNLGINRLLGFVKFLKALAKGDYETASKEMLDSKWAEQVGERAQRLAEIMETGTWDS